MALEDFEKSLAEERHREEHRSSREKHSHGKRHHHHHHRHSHRHHNGEKDQHRHKRRRPSTDSGGHNENMAFKKNDHHVEHREKRNEHGSTSPKQDTALTTPGTEGDHLKRDSWMMESSGMEYDFTQRGARKDSEAPISRPSKADYELKIHDAELNKHHLQELADGKAASNPSNDAAAETSTSYTFGDAGSSWRMMKLKAVYRKADELKQSVDDVAVEQYGELKFFDDAREELRELERCKTYGKGYVCLERPSGELFAERRFKTEVTEPENPAVPSPSHPMQGQKLSMEDASSATSMPLDQSALNRLKAQMIKARLKGGSVASTAEAEYNTALANFANRKQADVVVLGASNNRMLAGGREGEVQQIDTKRGRERGLVQENEDMTIEDMIREERRTKGQEGGDGRRFAERIAKDAKFDTGLDYLDENAAKLAKRVQKSDLNLKNMAISDFQKINRILDKCPLCSHEDSGKPPLAPVISLATRVYLSLPTEPEISDGSACIVPVQHRDNLLHCDEDEWEEIRNFMKSLTRLYHEQGRDVIFYENAAAPHRKRHAAMEVVPLPYSLGETAPAFFKEAFLTTDEEWTQHRKIIDTLQKSKDGMGKFAFRRSLAKEMPYFHVWFHLDGGLGHIVEDANRWPKGDLFAREIIGGMLDIGPEVIKRQGKWVPGVDRRVAGFQKRWRKFDWTRVLYDE